MSVNDQHVLASFGVEGIIRSVSPATGTVNRIVLLETTDGSFALRCSSRARLCVDWEHVAIAWAGDHSVPVCRPIPLSNGETILEHDGKFYALFPNAPGQQIARGDLQTAHAHAAGECLARIHSAFANFPMDQSPQKKLTINIAKTLAEIPIIEKVILELPKQTDTERSALHQLSGRREWLRHCDVSLHEWQETMARLPQAVLHGDYQETNLFFQDGEVVAVIDWEQSGKGPRSYDILRALHLMLGLDPALCRGFLDGYRSVYGLPDDELEIMTECYEVLANSNLWVFMASYWQKNERVKQFIGDGPFVPFREQWKKMRSE